MRGFRVFNIVSMAAVLAAVGACSESTSTGTLTTKQLGSKKPIRLSNRGKHIGSADSDLSLLTGARPPKDAKVDQDTLTRLGDAAMKRGQYASAAAFYDRAVRLDPRNVAQRKKLAFALFHGRMLARAKIVFTATAALAPDDPEVLRGLGNTQVALGEPKVAIATYRRALKASHGRFADYRIYNGLGVALDLSGRHSDAQRTYRLGLAQSPGSGSLRNNYALSLSAAGRHAEAVRLLSTLVRENPASAKYQRNLKRVRVAAKAGTKVSANPPVSDTRPPTRSALRPAHTTSAPPRRQTAARREPTAQQRRRNSRTVGLPRRLIPKKLPDIKELAERARRRDAPLDPGPSRTAGDPPERIRPPVAVAQTPANPPVGVADPADRELLARLRPDARRPAANAAASQPTRVARTPPRPAAMQAAALNRLAPASGPRRKPSAPEIVGDEPGAAEKADRLFLQALHGRPAKP